MYQFQTMTAFFFAINQKYLEKQAVLCSWDKTRIAKHPLRHNLRNPVLTNFLRFSNADNSVALFFSTERHSRHKIYKLWQLRKVSNVYIFTERNQKKSWSIISFSRLSCSHCWNQSVETCSIFMQQNSQYVHFRVSITFYCMFVITNFHSQKLKFPMSKHLPLAKYFSGGGNGIW